ncbi:hypothetical protein WJX72_003432 [[Myrmecia] bisecta]|uniref:Uncharacterized protein n=1 Tax=[Myrmecia] bisecta TaxID=41462 RepID=A0AAW1PS00_9CHLO
MLQRFETKVREASKSTPERLAAEQRWIEADLELQDAKVWFWRFRAEHRPTVHEKQKVEAAARAVLVQQEKERDKRISDAKAELGLWSELGLHESRALFWRSFESGKVFARRQTFWDTVVNIMTARERNALTMALELLFTALINFTVGMFVSVFAFVFRLPSLLMSYQPSLVSGLTFFAVSFVGAVSVVLGFLGLLYATSATALYAAASLVASTRRVEGGGQRYPPAYLRQHQE